MKSHYLLMKSYHLRNIILSLSLLILAACQFVAPVTEPGLESSPAQSSSTEIVRTNRASPRLTNDSLAPPLSKVTYDDLWDRIAASFQLQNFYSHPSVIKQLENYQNNQRYFDLITQRARPFLFEIVEEIESREFPLELVLVPVVESTFNPNAYSREHAVGLWQFLGPTGRSVGLQQDWWYDGRRDPLAATRAALDYLDKLYQQFDQDWLLALAAYNTGDGNVRRAIRRSGLTRSEAKFWDLQLPRETQNHVPRILALASIVANSEEYGITLTSIPNHALMKSVEVGAQMDIAKAAGLAEMDYQQLREFNPGYLQWATHPDQPQQLLLPIENALKLVNGLREIDKNTLLSWDRYEILAGDTLGAIARKLGTRVDVLQTVNGLHNSRIIAGNSLLIPRSENPELIALNQPHPGLMRTTVSVPANYRVRRGDNLWSIARKFDLRSKEIASWNSIELDQLLHPGQELDLSFAQPRTVN